MLNKSSALIGSMTSCHPSPIALKTLTMLCPMFLNEFINNNRPLSLSILSINSSMGIPSFFAVSLSSFIEAICLSVYPFDFN